MSNKDLVIEAVRELPDEASLEEIAERIAILAAVRRGEEAADAGQVVPHEAVKARIATSHTPRVCLAAPNGAAGP
jgi:predicted transcriptional regulator